MTSFKFHTNPFSSQVGQRIERATDSSLPSEDWSLFIEICDIINDTEDGAKDAIKAIKKRLSAKKDFKSLMYTLTLLESCMKNCGNRFHMIAANKDILGDLTKILSTKGIPNQIPQIVQEKILMLVQSWSDAFRNTEHLQAFVHCHENLKAQGFEFPAQDMESLAPIHTPKRTVPESETPRPVSRPQSSAVQEPRAVGSSGPINATPTQLTKLRADLNIVEENVRVMNDMLTELAPEQEQSDDITLLKDLNATCRQMQQRLIELLGRVANDEVTGELLRINDSLNNVFIRFDRFERNRTGASQPTSELEAETPSIDTSASVSAVAAENRSNDNMLIDFSDSGVSTEPGKPSTVVADDEFDMFAQTRSSTFADSRKGGSTYEDNITNVPTESFAGMISKSTAGPQSEEKNMEDEIQDVEEWLKDTDLNQLVSTRADPSQQASDLTASNSQRQQQQQQSNQAHLTSEEFDRFLAERSSAGPERISSTRGSAGAPRQMQMMAAEPTEDKMFSL